MATEQGSNQLRNAQKSIEMAEAYYGMIPNMIEAVNRHNPAVAQFYIAASEALQNSNLQDNEREAVILTISRYNDCHYCVRAHAALGYEAGLSEADIQDINQGKLPAKKTLRGFVKATRLILDKNGWLDADDISQLEKYGITRMHLYEINALIAIKTLSNYINHIEQTQVDDAFEAMMPENMDQAEWASSPEEALTTTVN